MGYRIKTVAELLQIPRNTLLAWERRYDIVQPARQANGYREYSDEDVRRLRQLKSLIDDGYRVGEAVSLLNTTESASMPAEASLETGLREEILAALLRFDRQSADELLRQCSMLSFERQIDEIFFPIQRNIGELWAEDALTISEEHIVSHFVREKLQGMLMALDYGPVGGRHAICAAYSDEDHDIALMGLAVKLALRNYRVTYIGARTPLNELAALIRQHAPVLVCLSYTMPKPLPEVLEAARTLSAAVEKDTRIAIGGRGIPRDGLPTIPHVTWIHRTQDLLD